MLEKNQWPQWLKNLLPNWLENITYPAPGVGDQNDLRFSLGVGDGGKWIGFVNSGWFYHDNIEQYNYIYKGVASIAATSGTVLAAQPGFTVSNAVSGTITNSVSWRPAWGPVLVNSYVSSGSTQNYEPYVLHNNAFWPGISLSWVSSGNLYTAALPSSSVLIGMRDLTNLAMGSVASTGQLLSEKLYYYDYTNNRVWVKPKINLAPSCWADIIYYSPQLKMREVVTQSVSGVKASYRNIEQITVFKGNQTTSYTGKVTGGTYFTHALTGVVVGDWVGLEYYITKSYILKDHRNLQYYVTSPSSGDNFIINHETSLPELIPEATLALPIVQNLNFNPLYSDSFRSGFLFHSNPLSGITNYWTPSSLKVYLDKTEVCGDWNEYLHMSLYAYGDNGLPLPNYPLTIGYTPTASVLAATSTATGASYLTNGKGELHVLFAPASGTYTFTASSTLGSFTATATSNVLTFTNMVSSGKWLDGFVNVLITDDTLNNYANRTYLNATNLDGIPRSASGTKKITLKSTKASEFSINNLSFSKSIDLTVDQDTSPTNIGGVVEIGYRGQPNDEIAATSGEAQSIVLDGTPNNDV